MPTSIPRRRVLTAAAAGAASLAFGASAQSGYPDRPIKLIVPFAPGGATDITARMVADRLRIELGQPVVMDNRPGATGTIGTQAAMRSPADGYTLMFTTSTNQVIAPLLLEKPPYDGARDFAPITLLIHYLGVLMVSTSVPGRTLADFMAYAKQRPGKLNYASSGVGSTNHLLGELFKSRTGLDLVHVPYKGSAAAVQALAADEVQMYFDTVPNAQIWMKQGKVKVLALSSDARSSLMPGVPTLVELGVLDAGADYWMGLMAPLGTPAPIIARVREAAAKGMASAEMQQFAANGGGEISTGTPEQLAKLLVDEQRRWGEVIRRNNIRAE
ncbi:MAG: tripartite tricarboxylate transporter substrate binding protein [Pseudacidovorax sp.]|uniref:Bug family tripartite tricarboxylate transporter substrate binding protein n=1 Tax=Pseudacidovorax sp. TaxID=1934311 RepID=UPI001B660209|nr:tripartite tricarboxylate transporter substrate binding protein [Pseudacidovorax sp.]MBP6895559.1 tripartite tricarboxylate transporter substrate binding protein [Pseudacidovorax sp.]